MCSRIVMRLLTGHGDLNFLGVPAGCDELLFAVQHRIRPKFHVFGHVHEGKLTASSCLLTDDGQLLMTRPL